MNVPYVHMIMNGRRQAAQGHSLKRGVIRRGLTLGLAAGLWLALVPTQAVADVSQPTWSKWYSVSFGQRAQTFTAPSTGGLDHVSLMLNYDYGYGSAGTVDVHNVDATTQQPTGSALPGSVVDLHGPTMTYAYPFFKFPFASPIPVTGGKTYAIVMTTTAGVRSWAGMTSAPAVDVGGRAWTAPGCVSGCTWSSTGYFPYDFAFEAGLPTAPAPGGNSVPAVKANINPVSVPEGAIPTNTGTFSDPDGDTVTLSPSANTGSAGTVTPSGAGTWSWKGAAADEGQGQTITITADDGHGNTAKAQFSTVVENALPKATISGAPTGGAREGTTITLTASATSPSAEDAAGVFIFSWSVQENSNPPTTSGGPTLTLKTDDEGLYTVTLIATDDGGVPSPLVTATINGVDVKPTAAITGFTQSFVIVPQQPLTFNGNFSDAGSVVDPAASYQVTWAWGDNSPNTTDTTGGTGNHSATHTYTASGTYTVTMTAADDDGVAGSATTTVTILTPEAALAKITTFVQGVSGLNAGQRNSLLVKIKAANDSMQRTNYNAACGQLNAFANEVDADQKAGRLTSGDAGTLIDAARQTQRSLGCFQTLVEFLNGL
jgi:PKD domain